MTISWNKYIGWENNISGYIIFWKTDAGNYQRLNGVSPQDSSYIHYGIQQNTRYYYFIQGIKNDGKISRSNTSTYYTYMPGPPEELLLDLVTVASPNLAEISFHFTDTSQIQGFRLLRSSEAGADFQSIKTVSNLSGTSYTFQDSILSNLNIFYYKIGSLNSCLKLIKESNTGVNLLLRGEYSEGQVILNWNEYESFPAGLEEYRIYRQDTDGNFSILANTAPGITSFTDNLQNIYATGLSGDLIYQIRAKTLGEEIFSVSNPLSIKTKTRLSMPNAFTPNHDGKNDTFKPVLSFIPTKFIMIIYDRNGEIVFQTEDPFTGWDGTIKGNNPASEGVYVYHIQFTSYNGTAENQTGKVMVFYP